MIVPHLDWSWLPFKSPIWHAEAALAQGWNAERHCTSVLYTVWHTQIVLFLSCEALPSMMYCRSLLWDMSACGGQLSWDPSSGFGSHCSLPCQTLPNWLCPLQPPLLHWMLFWLQKQALLSSLSLPSAPALPACLTWCWDLLSSHLKCRFDTCHSYCAVRVCPVFLHCHSLCPYNPFTECINMQMWSAVWCNTTMYSSLSMSQKVKCVLPCRSWAVFCSQTRCLLCGMSCGWAQSSRLPTVQLPHRKQPLWGHGWQLQ